jgi:hypothetical protein
LPTNTSGSRKQPVDYYCYYCYNCTTVLNVIAGKESRQAAIGTTVSSRKVVCCNSSRRLYLSSVVSRHHRLLGSQRSLLFSGSPPAGPRFNKIAAVSRQICKKMQRFTNPIPTVPCRYSMLPLRFTYSPHFFFLHGHGE